MRGAAILLFLCTGACGGDTAFIKLPDFSDAIQSWLMARVTEDGAVEVNASDREHPSLRHPVARSPVVLEVRAFDAPLSQLQLGLGPVPPAEAGEFSSLLPEGQDQYVAELRGAALTPWQEGGPTPKLAAFRFRRPSPCYTITSAKHELEVSSTVRWAENHGPDAVVFGFGSPFSAVLSSSVADASVQFWAYAPGVVAPRTVVSSFRDASGRLWLGDDLGALWRGTIVVGALQLEKIVEGNADRGDIVALDGDPAAPEGELYALSSHGTLYQLAGSDWQQVGSLGSGANPDFLQLLWLSPGYVIASEILRSALLLRRPDGTLQDVGRFASGQGVTALGRVGRDDAVIATRGRELWRLKGGALELLGTSGLSLDVLGFTSLGDHGFLYFGAGGYVAQWDWAAHACPFDVEVPAADNTVWFVKALGPDFVALGAPDPGRNTTYARLTLRGGR